MRPARAVIAVLIILAFGLSCPAQDERAQYPLLLRNSYVGLQLGFIGYPFSNTQFQTGFRAESVQVPHLAVRALLMGHDFNRYFAAQLTYMRPVEWVHYRNVNGDQIDHSVWMNAGGLTIKARVPVAARWSAYGEAGLGIITRKGFEINQVAAVKDANYASLLMGAGVRYQVNDNWDLTAGVTASPSHARDRQPRTTFLSGGFNYTMRKLSQDQVEQNTNTGFSFPKNLLQFGYTTDALGYGTNDFVSKRAVPVFWAADVRVAHGVSAGYQRNVFHTRRVFALDWGIGGSSWRTRKDGEHFATASLYPVLRFTAVRTQPMDVYFAYSLAGPSFISRTTIDGGETGRRFTFQDYMALGFFASRKRHLNFELRIVHFSNGNLFPRNAGVTVPIGFHAGYAF